MHNGFFHPLRFLDAIAPTPVSVHFFLKNVGRNTSISFLSIGRHTLVLGSLATLAIRRTFSWLKSPLPFHTLCSTVSNGTKTGIISFILCLRTFHTKFMRQFIVDKKETYIDDIVRSWLLVPKASEANFAFKTWVYGIQSAFKMCIWQ